MLVDQKPSLSMPTLRPVIAAAYGMHVADQIALVGVPLLAELVFDASPAAIGVLVACQSLAQLVGSIPFGLVVDHCASRRVAVASTIISVLGFLGAWLSLVAFNLVAFGLSIVFAGFGIVLFVLVVLSMIPTIANEHQMARANSRIEVPRSLASFVVPLIVGATITTGSAQLFLAAAMACGCVAMCACFKFANIAPTSRETSLGRGRLRIGWRFVITEPHLRAITLCSLAWNFGFTVLLVAMLPFLDAVGLEPGVFGLGFAFFGLAAVIGSWLAGVLATRISPRLVLVFGPASSIAAASVVLGTASTHTSATIFLGFFLLGFGPSMWLVSQNTVRQLVTPREMLGRVNSVIQTAIYGVRPIGAIVGGLVVTASSPIVCLLLVIALFAVSTVVALASNLRNVHTYAGLT